MFPATIVSVAPAGDARAHTFDAKIVPTNQDPRLLPGMFAQVQVIAQQKPDAILVPKEAIVQQGNNQVVFVNDNGKASQRPVQIGIIDNKSAEVVSGLAAGEQVVVVGQTGLRDGAAIRVVNGAPNQGSGPASRRWPGPAGRPTRHQTVQLVSEGEATSHAADSTRGRPAPDGADGTAGHRHHGRGVLHIPEDRPAAAHQHSVRQRPGDLHRRDRPGRRAARYPTHRKRRRGYAWRGQHHLAVQRRQLERQRPARRRHGRHPGRPRGRAPRSRHPQSFAGRRWRPARQQGRPELVPDHERRHHGWVARRPVPGCQRPVRPGAAVGAGRRQRQHFGRPRHGNSGQGRLRQAGRLRRDRCPDPDSADQRQRQCARRLSRSGRHDAQRAVARRLPDAQRPRRARRDTDHHRGSDPAARSGHNLAGLQATNPAPAPQRHRRRRPVDRQAVRRQRAAGRRWRPRRPRQAAAAAAG